MPKPQLLVEKAEQVKPDLILYLLKHMLGMGCVDSAAIFNMDHTSAIHSCRRVQDIIDTEENFAKEIRRIKENIF